MLKTFIITQYKDISLYWYTIRLAQKGREYRNRDDAKCLWYVGIQDPYDGGCLPPCSQSEGLQPIRGTCSSSTNPSSAGSEPQFSARVLVHTKVAFCHSLQFGRGEGRFTSYPLSIVFEVLAQMLCISHLVSCNVYLSHLPKWGMPGADGEPTMGERKWLRGFEKVYMVCVPAQSRLCTPPIIYNSTTL